MSYLEKNKAFFTNSYVRAALRSAVYHLCFSAVAYFLFLLIFKNLMKPMLLDGMFDAIRYLLGFMSVGLFGVIQGLLVNAYRKNQQNKKRYLDMTAHCTISQPQVQGKLLKIALGEALATTIPLAVFSAFNAIFYASYGFLFGSSLFFEDFNILYVGIFQLVGNGGLAYFLMLAVCFAVAFFGRMILHRKWEEERL